MSTITSKVTVNPIYQAALNAIDALRKELTVYRGIEDCGCDVKKFEDTMNALSGSIQNLPQNQINTIMAGIQEVVNTAKNDYGITISLAESITPKEAAQQVKFTLAKELYPLTKTVFVDTSTAVDVVEEETPEVNFVFPEVLIDDEVIDEVFVEQDTELVSVVDEVTLAEEPEISEPILPQFMVDASLRAAANVNGLQAGLVEFSSNPLKSLTDDTIALVLSYTSNNYAGLNSALSQVSSNVSLAAEYTKFREALGGGDGLSGSVAHLNNFVDHTNRLSGLVLDKDSENAEPDDDSTEEHLSFEDIPANTMTGIISFDANKFRSAKYLIQGTSSREHQVSDLYILHDNKFVYTREINAIYSTSPFISFTSALANGRIEVKANSSLPNTDFVIYGVRLRIARNSDSYSKISQTKILENHQTLENYLQDGVDYARLQSGSLYKPFLVEKLNRELTDMISNMSSAEFAALPLATAQQALLDNASTINTRNADIQQAIDDDYAQYEAATKKAEALSMAYTITSSFQTEGGRGVLERTLNNRIRTELESSE